MYADDTNIDAVSDDINKVENVLNNELAIVDKWCTNNKLIINAKKNNSMVICTYQKRRFLPKTSLNVHINNVKIINVTSDKILGVHLDNNLLMDTHINNLCLKLSRLCGLLYRIQNCLSFQAKLLFYNSYVQPCFDYCATTWGFCSDSQINRLSRLQKRFGRLILNDPECSSKDIFIQLKWLTIKERLEFLTVVLV